MAKTKQKIVMAKQNRLVTCSLMLLALMSLTSANDISSIINYVPPGNKELVEFELSHLGREDLDQN